MNKLVEDKAGESTQNLKHRRTRGEWQTLIEAWRRSNQTQRAFCHDQGLRYQQFSQWKRRLTSAPASEPDRNEAAFIPVHWQTPQSTLAHGLPIILPNGIRIVIHDQEQLSWLPGIAKALMGVSC